jgi:hypothetical protein
MIHNKKKQHLGNTLLPHFQKGMLLIKQKFINKEGLPINLKAVITEIW